jgi:hypothetical protein
MPHSSSRLENIPGKRQALSSAFYLLRAGFVLGLFFDLEDGGDMFLQNVG